MHDVMKCSKRRNFRYPTPAMMMFLSVEDIVLGEKTLVIETAQKSSSPIAIKNELILSTE